MAVKWRVQGNLKRITADIKSVRPRAVVYAIGDASHKSRKSDHNVWNWGYGDVVSAIDIMIRNGFTNADAEKVVAELVGRSDIQYVIWNGHIWNRDYGWRKRVYTGSDKHTDHIHASARHTSAADNDLRGLPKFMNKVSNKPLVKPVSLLKPYPGYILVKGMKGRAAVRTLQARLNELKVGGGVGAVDGDFGPRTLAAVRRWQMDHKLVVDGKVGERSWNSLFAKS